MANRSSNIQIKNKKATFDYEILEEWVAGIVLTGTEIKSIRAGKASLTDCYCYFSLSGELWVRGMNVSEYFWGTRNSHIPKRDRKLLLQKKELRKLKRAIQDKGLTIVGMKLFINERGLAKILIGLARGKKVYDKRETIKEREAKRDLQRDFKK